MNTVVECLHLDRLEQLLISQTYYPEAAGSAINHHHPTAQTIYPSGVICPAPVPIFPDNFPPAYNHPMPRPTTALHTVPPHAVSLEPRGSYTAHNQFPLKCPSPCKDTALNDSLGQTQNQVHEGPVGVRTY